jgi:hypothetical protein
MKTRLHLLIALAFAISASAQTAPVTKITSDDLRALEGNQWIGSLTYLDYGSGKKTTIKSNVTISRSTQDNIWLFDYQYPEEPKANSKAELVLSTDGTVFDGQTVIENSKLADGLRRIVTTKPGSDNNRKALYRFTYDIGKDKFTVRKDVRIDGATEYFERNTYSWAR